MTLIIGIKCPEGVVIGADGAATLGALGNSTVLQPTKKLDAMYEKMIVGVSGPVGLGQRIKGEIKDTYNLGSLSGKKPYEAMAIISTNIRKHIIPELQTATIASQAIGQSVALQSALSQTLVAVPVSGELCLFQFDQQGSPEQTNDELPFVSIGSGEVIADPFLAFIRRVLWENKCPPNINNATFAVIWTLMHAVKSHPGGVALPVQIMSLTNNGKAPTVKEYTQEELAEHIEAIDDIEKQIKNIALGIKDDKPVAIPKPNNN